jgi:hypothetical protein
MHALDYMNEIFVCCHLWRKSGAVCLCAMNIRERKNHNQFLPLRRFDIIDRQMCSILCIRVVCFCVKLTEYRPLIFFKAVRRFLVNMWQ